MPRVDPNIQAHLDWMGFVQPQGLVVSAPALVRAGAILNRNDREGQERLAECVEEQVFSADGHSEPWLPNFDTFARRVLGWNFSPRAFERVLDSESPDSTLLVTLEEYGETLRPDYAVRHWPPPENGMPPWQLLVRVVGPTQDFDKKEPGSGMLEATAHGRMERLLRATGVNAGVIFNGRVLRLISAPRGENSGWLDFRVADMLLTAGRPIVAAMKLLLGQNRLLTGPQDKRLPALLKESRNYQNVVSERLAEQVLHALYELLRGFQAAQDASRGTLLGELLENAPNTVYRALLTVILRLVFLLYAEQRDLLPDDETFVRYYSLAGLHDRLREDAAQYPDTMDQRYGAWAQLVVLFRIIHDGARSGSMVLPQRQGALFDPGRFGFLESVPVQEEGTRQVPLVPDGTVFRILEKLLVLDGEKISYRALDVEQIGSVYETMMGFRLESATGRSISIRAQKKGGAPSTIDLEQLLAESSASRKKWIRDRTDREITDKVNRAVRSAATIDELYAALEPVVDKNATPDLVRRGSMILQPSEDRRRSGSHYTPRSLTEPIVRRTLDPVLEAVKAKHGGRLQPEHVLEIKVCDPAMGSGAFLVEACRQLGDALVEAWRAEGFEQATLEGEDEVIAARRAVARKCLYGVDRNPVAVDLAKMSIWLASLSKDQPLTFLDHALRHGDSLLGLTRDQIESFHWRGDQKRFDRGIEYVEAKDRLERAFELRQRIRDAGEDVSQSALTELWASAEEELGNVRLLGDLVIHAFFGANNPRARERRRAEAAQEFLAPDYSGQPNPLDKCRHAEKPLAAFHWEIEFPEVFERENPGFDGIIGNPPFAGKNTVIAANAEAYPSWLKVLHAGSHGNADQAAHFFRRAFSLLRSGANLGLVATNTIAQGDTRSTGLRWICTNGGEIYNATRRLPWPGLAAVVVSVLHIHRGPWGDKRLLDGTDVPAISAYLASGSSHEDPARLKENEGQSFVGSYVLGMGFTFDDTDKKGVASSIAEMHRLIEKDRKNQEAIFPYIGGEELNSSPTHAHHRYVINFWDYPLRRDPNPRRSWFKASEETQKRWWREGEVPYDYPRPVAEDWPDLLEIVKQKVFPQRRGDKEKSRRERWWQYGRRTPGLHHAIEGMDRVLAISAVGQHAAFSFLPNGMVYAHRLIVMPIHSYSGFCVLQSRLHETWVRRFSSTLGDGLCYSPTDCFETFPFPKGWRSSVTLEEAGKQYYQFRRDFMATINLGLTQTYNRFHDPYCDDADIVQLRTLHDQMDRVVLDKFGWSDIEAKSDFLSSPDIKSTNSSRRSRRYRWSNEVESEILARLIDQNAQRSRDERRQRGRSDLGSRPAMTRPNRPHAKVPALFGTLDD